jgi:hypothetical protein
LIEMIATAATANRALHPEGCLFCRPHDGGFESEEHIFSYALGNREYTLPPGIVCDRCNKGPLAKADEAISSFPPIQMLRGERGLGTRKKKPLVLSMHVTEVWWEAPGEMCIRAANAGVMMRTGASSGTLNLTSGKPTPERLFRRITYSVWKTALEELYRRHGPQVAFDSKFDRVREAVIWERESGGWCVCPKEGKPHNWVALSVLPGAFVNGQERTPVGLDIFGIMFLTDLLALDLDPASLTFPVAMNVWSFGPRRRSGCDDP